MKIIQSQDKLFSDSNTPLTSTPATPKDNAPGETLLHLLEEHQECETEVGQSEPLATKPLLEPIQTTTPEADEVEPKPEPKIEPTGEPDGSKATRTPFKHHYRHHRRHHHHHSSVGKVVGESPSIRKKEPTSKRRLSSRRRNEPNCVDSGSTQSPCKNDNFFRIQDKARPHDPNGSVKSKHERDREVDRVRKSRRPLKPSNHYSSGSGESFTPSSKGCVVSDDSTRSFSSMSPHRSTRRRDSTPMHLRNATRRSRPLSLAPSSTRRSFRARSHHESLQAKPSTFKFGAKEANDGKNIGALSRLKNKLEVIFHRHHHHHHESEEDGEGRKHHRLSKLLRRIVHRGGDHETIETHGERKAERGGYKGRRHGQFRAMVEGLVHHLWSARERKKALKERESTVKAARMEAGSGRKVSWWRRVRGGRGLRLAGRKQARLRLGAARPMGGGMIIRAG